MSEPPQITYTLRLHGAGLTAVVAVQSLVDQARKELGVDDTVDPLIYDIELDKKAKSSSGRSSYFYQSVGKIDVTRNLTDVELKAIK